MPRNMRLSTRTREKEAAASDRDPAGVIKGQTAGGNERVQVWMMSQVLRPGVQHGKHTDAMHRDGVDQQRS